MTLVSPNLDDRDWRQLVDAARRRIRELCPDWSDLSPSDPGMVLVEAFAHLTEVLIYRVNRIPEKAYVEFLRLLGVTLRPPSAATVVLEFRRGKDTEAGAIRVPRGTRVASPGGTPVFHTLDELTVGADEESARVRAIHAEVDRLSVVGTGTGRPGQQIAVPRPPLVKGESDGFDFAVFVETAQAASADAEIDGRKFRRWQEVSNFATTGPDEAVFIVDRAAGTISFAPAVQLDRPRLLDDPEAGDPVSDAVERLGGAPKEGRQIRVTCLRGGGAFGNVRPATLTLVLDTVGGLEVTNSEAAAGGADGETLDHALRRGPTEMRNPDRAVTAIDYELAAERVAVVGRAKAFTQRDLWLHALPGTVEVVLVPALAPNQPADQQVRAAELRELQSEEGRTRVFREVDQRRPLGTRLVASWAGYKTVRVYARLVVHADRDVDDVRGRVVKRLHGFLHPLRGGGGTGWRFGQSLHVSHVYEMCLSQPGVVFVDLVRLEVEDAPSGPVEYVAADSQPNVWYASNGNRLFRSLNAGGGWEVSSQLEGEHVAKRIAPHPLRHGWVAFLAEHPKRSLLRISSDCGETWPIEFSVGAVIHDLAWTTRDEEPLLLLATDKGLFWMEARPDAMPELVPQTPVNEYWAVAVSDPQDGIPTVALSTRQKGVFVSRENAAEGSFVEVVGPDRAKYDVRSLAFQSLEGRTWLWGGVFILGSGKGDGALRWELAATRTETVKRMELLSEGWRFVSCRGFAFVDGNRKVLAATSLGDVVGLDTKAREPKWEITSEDQGLPYFEKGRKPILSIASQAVPFEDDQGRRSRRDHVMLCGDHGIWRSEDGGLHFRDATSAAEIVTLPQTWLFSSGDHEVEVVHERVREPSSRAVSSEEAAP